MSDQHASARIRFEEKLARIRVLDRACRIPRYPSGDPARLSFAQERLWFLDSLYPGQSIYNLAHALRFNGELDIAALQRSLSDIVARHESLRTRVKVADGETYQDIQPPVPVELPVVDLTGLDPDLREVEGRRLTTAEMRRPFDLLQGPLFRAGVIKMAAEDHILLLPHHHIISDGWSLGLLNGELSALYRHYVLKEPLALPELEIQYRDYSVWQRHWLQGSALDEQLSYWRTRLDGAPPKLELPTDRPHPPVQSHRGAIQALTLPGRLTRRLSALSREQNVTLFMTLMAAFQLLIGRYARTDDVVIGTAIAGRSLPEIEKVIGFFANTVVFRTSLAGNPTFRQLALRVRDTALGAYEHQAVPFDKLVEALQPARDLRRNPIFQVMFNLQDDDASDIPAIPGVSATQAPYDGTVTARFDLNLSVTRREDGLLAELLYATDLFDAATISRMLESYSILLERVADNPDSRISMLPLLSEESSNRLLLDCNDTARVYPRRLCVHEFISAQARETPAQIAIRSDDRQLSYAELEGRSNQLARCLRAAGVGPEVVVGVCAGRSIEAVVALLGILKAGGVYLPLDPTYPADRLAYMITSARTSLVLGTDGFEASLPAEVVARIDLDVEWSKLASFSSEPLPEEAHPANLAYLIYTSGSTGQPKGVMITHEAMAAHILAKIEDLKLCALDKVAHTAPLSFDISLWQMLAPLSVGGTCIAYSAQVCSESRSLLQTMARDEITIYQPVPSMLRVLLTDPALGEIRHVVRLRVVVSVGEVLPPALCHGWFDIHPDIPLVNSWGATEVADCATHFWIRSDTNLESSVPIGRSLPNYRVYVLDSAMNPVPVGVAGELNIGGIGVGRGYWRLPGLTAERFIPNPFGDGDRLYRTGDLGCWRADGSLEFLGRVDHQVKVRGFRIELGEVEHALSSLPNVDEAVVMVQEESSGDRYLVGYVVVGKGKALDTARLRTELRRQLPEYMVPSAFIVLDRLPLTPSGKIDRKRLPPLVREATMATVDYAAPKSPTEELIAAIWADLLQREAVGCNDNFFDIGGHSLLGMRVMSRMRTAFGIEVPLQALFEMPTVRDLARWITEHQANCGVSLPPLMPCAGEGLVPLSFTQERVWFLDQLFPGLSNYNILYALRLRGDFDAAAMQRSVSDIIARHESLRTRFLVAGGQVCQKVDPVTDVEFPIVDLSALDPDRKEVEALRLTAAEVRRPFDLQKGPLFRAGALKLAEDDHVLLLPHHHIISDGWSLGLLNRELAILYRHHVLGEPLTLPELPVQYRDYSVWQRRWLQGPALDEHLSYWRTRLDGAPPALELPTDRPRPAVQSFRGSVRAVALPVDLSQGLAALSRQENVTLFMTLMAAFQLLLGRYAQAEDIVTGTLIAGRTVPEIENLIGFFPNTVVIRTSLAGRPTFRQLLQRVRDSALGAYAHQDLPFEKLVEVLRPGRDLSRNPIFQTMFIFQNTRYEMPDLPRINASRVTHLADACKLDLVFELRYSADCIAGWIEYASDLFNESTIAGFVEDFQDILAIAATQPSIAVDQFPSYRPRSSGVTNDGPMRDRQMLPHRATKRAPAGIEPATAKFKDIWTRFLPGTKGQQGERFFDCGGTSLIALQMVAAFVASEWDVKLRDFFEFQEFQSLCDEWSKRSVHHQPALGGDR
ncbi:MULTISPECIES: non-ribosomal peptide synthetase [unclassified Bradyrhizobium]|uniref:non-ribosomal peptide synthetase n=1 Tax=unclassified Bradyrhizobium TaxID=2631580 RepID=UPI002916542D|nr:MULTISPECIES: non-ribosomal peptide synthetase [unclassified Bradyrhizobium]